MGSENGGIPTLFDGESYDIWGVRIEAFWDALYLWDDDYEVFSLPEDPTMAHVKTHKERKTKRKKCVYLQMFTKCNRTLKTNKKLELCKRMRVPLQRTRRWNNYLILKL
jgi:hypothetical protein